MIGRQRFYVEIDALADTRLGLVLQHRPERYGKIDLAEYRKRHTNAWYKFIGISREEWAEWWENRDVDTLKQSGPTTLLFQLVKEMGSMYARTLLGWPGEAPELTVNIWPYTLEQRDLQDYKDNLEILFGSSTKNIFVISKPLVDITPTYLNNCYEAATFYDIHSWIDIHMKDLCENSPMPSFTIACPAILRDGVEKEVLDQITVDKVNPFTEIKSSMATLVTMEALDANLFSLRLVESPPSEPSPNPS